MFRVHLRSQCPYRLRLQPQPQCMYQTQPQCPDRLYTSNEYSSLYSLILVPEPAIGNYNVLFMYLAVCFVC